MSRIPGSSFFAAAIVVLLFFTPSAAMAERNLNETIAGEIPELSFRTEAEVLDYIAASEDFAGQFQPHIVPGAAFISDGFDPNSSLFSFFTGYIRGTSAADGCVRAPVQLPDGATVVNLFGYLYDDDSASNITLTLRRKQNAGTFPSEEMAAVSTSGDSTSVQIPGDTVDFGEVNTMAYSYFLTTCLPSSDLRVHAAWIFVEPADDVFSVSGPEAQIAVTPSTGLKKKRTLLSLTNLGAPAIALKDASVSQPGWKIRLKGTALRFSRNGTKGAEVSFFKDGSVTMGANGSSKFRLKKNGNVTIAGTLTESSDVGGKLDISSVDAAAVLAAVARLPVSEWSYKHSPEIRHVGPMAQDFFAAFGLGEDESGIATLDTSGIALVALQALHAENGRLQGRLNLLTIGFLGFVVLAGVWLVRRPRAGAS